MDDIDHARLLQAIGQALGQPGPYQEHRGPREAAFSLATGHRSPTGEGRQVLGGAVDEPRGRVAWVEERVAPRVGEFVPVSIDLCLACGGRHEASLPVETYNPFFGCQVRLMRWYGEALLWIYREKHRTLLACVEPPYDRQRLAALSDRYVLDGDDLYFLGATGLLEGRRLPSMEALTPLPIPAAVGGCELQRPKPGEVACVRWPRRWSPTSTGFDQALEQARAGALVLRLPAPDERPLPADGRPLRGALLAAVAAGAPDGAAALLVDTVAAPFLRDTNPTGATYADCSQRARQPGFLVAYWVQHLRDAGQGAEAWLRWLDRVAEGEPRWGWPAGSCRLDVALAHLRARAAVLASTARTGATPYPEACHFFDEGGPSADALRGYPAHVLRAIDTLRPLSPEPLLWPSPRSP